MAASVPIRCVNLPHPSVRWAGSRRGIRPTSTEADTRPKRGATRQPGLRAQPPSTRLPLRVDALEPSPPTLRAFFRTRLAPLALLCTAMLGVGFALRVHAFGFPDTFLFDEHHFVENARNYLAGKKDWNDHPPFGKLLIAASISLFGDDPVGWRAPALLFGSVSVIAGGLAAARLFALPVAGLLAAALLAADGFAIAYSRAGLLDGYLAALGVLALLVASHRPSPWTAVVGGGVAGLALAIKFSGVAVLVPLVLAPLLAGYPKRRTGALGALTVVVALGSYTALYALGLSIAGQPASVANVFAETRRLFEHHAVLTEMKNPATSGWVTWAVPLRPLWLGYHEGLGSVRALTSLGNPLVWWSAVALFGSCIASIAYHGVASALGRGGAASDERAAREPERPAELLRPAPFVAAHGKAVLLLLSAALAFLAPWVLTHRDSYIYHFLPSYSALIVLLAGFLAFSLEARPRFVLGFVAAAWVVLAFYAPVWSFFETTPEMVRLRMFLPSWR